MQPNLQEFHNLLQEKFPKIDSKVIYQILFSIHGRLKKHQKIGFSRYEYEKFWVSEKQLRAVIDYLRDFWVLEFSHTTMSTNKKRIINRDFQKCNVYDVSESFREMILSFQKFIKNTFEYVNPIVFMKNHFKYKQTPRHFIFKHNGVKYIISKFWKFSGVIFDTSTKKIINPLTLL